MHGLNTKKDFLIGAKQVRVAISEGKAKNVYIARDSDPEIISPIESLAKEKNLTIEYLDTRQELGKMCGIDVKAACAVKTI